MRLGPHKKALGQTDQAPLYVEKSLARMDSIKED